MVEIAGEVKLFASLCFFFFLHRERLGKVGWSGFISLPLGELKGKRLRTVVSLTEWKAVANLLLPPLQRTSICSFLHLIP